MVDMEPLVELVDFTGNDPILVGQVLFWYQ